jgi:hypothetical protein
MSFHLTADRRKETMNRPNCAARIAVAVGIILGLAGPAAAGEQVPFQGSMEGMRVSFVPLEPPFMLATVVITGQSTQLGKYDLVITAIANPQAMMAEGTYEFVAANGDTVTADFIGAGGPTEIPGVVLRIETATITGGTGRFAGATGSFEVVRLFDTATLLTVGEFGGTISAPAH